MLPKHILDAQTFVANLPIPEPCAEALHSPIARGRISTNETVLAGVPALHTADFVRSLPDL
jgi:hypothetical protein